MQTWSQFLQHLRHRAPDPRAWSALRWLGPGMLVTVGFIDPGNWATNVAAGAGYGYALLWVVSLSTLMLILLQHNAAHLGIVTGLCLSESATRFLPAWISRPVLGTAVLAAVATAFAEVLGGAIALRMLFRLPLALGACLVALVVGGLLLWNTYRVIEKFIVGLVSIIGLAFLFELLLVRIQWAPAAVGWAVPSFPPGATFVIMGVLGAVVMPHNLFLHSEIIQSRQWNLQGEEAIRAHLRFELLDTLFSMGVGWAINSAMVLLAAATFFQRHVAVDSLEQAELMLRPILGSAATTVFALALLCAGLASTLTAGMAGGSIFAGIFDRSYDVEDRTSRAGILITLVPAALLACFVVDSFRALLASQIALSVQLPLTILLQLWLTSSRRVMGEHANTLAERLTLGLVAAAVIGLNLWLLKASL
jgi:manganese transport protein